MSLPAAIEMPDPLPVNSKQFDLAYPQLLTPVGAGFIQTIDRGPNLWVAKYMTPALSEDRDQVFQGFLDQLQGSNFTFLGFDPRRTRPYAYRTSSGASHPWTASNVVLASVDYANSQIAMTGWVVGAILTSRDYLAFQDGNIWRLHRVVGNYVANGSGNTPTVNVVPRPLLSGGTPNVRLIRAPAAMKVIGAVSKTDKVDDIGPLYTFNAVQFVDRS